MIKTEIDLAAYVVTWLKDLKWDVYQEVQFQVYGKIADIVAVQNKIVWVIEVKKSLTFKVIEQAMYWRGLAHYSSVAVSYRKNRDLAPDVCKWKGIGLIEVYKPDWDENVKINEFLRPRLYRNALSHYIIDCLSPELKTYAPAGSRAGSNLTPFKATCDNIRLKVAKNPGLTMKELMDGLDHHYSSSATARSCIGKWAFQGVIKGIRVERDGKFLKFYPELVSEQVQK